MTHRIALLPGDGIGPEVVAAARRVLEEVGERFGHRFDFEEAAIGGQALDVSGSPLPGETLRVCERCDALLLGAVGGPRWEGSTLRPEQGLLDLRHRFEFFANLRPVVVFPALRERAPLRPELLENVDLLIVRELTGGLYFGHRREQGDGDSACDTMIYSVAEVERVAHVAFQAARRRRGRVTSVDKANVLASMRLWRRVVTRVAGEYPDVRLEHQLVDSCAMELMRRPATFDVLLTGNLFGDILSDEAAVLAGSLGLLPSASLGPVREGGARKGLYEPVHGSAPDIAGRGVANPAGAILSAALMLRHSFGLEIEARAVEDAVASTLGVRRTADLVWDGEAPASTAEMTLEVVHSLRKCRPPGP